MNWLKIPKRFTSDDNLNSSKGIIERKKEKAKSDRVAISHTVRVGFSTPHLNIFFKFNNITFSFRLDGKQIKTKRQYYADLHGLLMDVVKMPRPLNLKSITNQSLVTSSTSIRKFLWIPSSNSTFISKIPRAQFLELSWKTIEEQSSICFYWLVLIGWHITTVEKS